MSCNNDACGCGDADFGEFVDNITSAGSVYMSTSFWPAEPQKPLFKSVRKPVVLEVGTEFDGAPYLHIGLSDEAGGVSVSRAELDLFLEDLEGALTALYELQEEYAAAHAQADGVVK